VVGYSFLAVVLVVTLIITCLATPERPSVRATTRNHLTLSTTAVGFGACFSCFVVGMLWILIDARVIVLSAVLLGGGALGSLWLGWRIPGLRSFVAPFQHRDFFWVFATRFFVQLGIFSIVPFIDFYFRDVMGAGDRSGAQSSLWLLVVIAAGIAPALLCGRISDRTGRRKVFVYIAGALQGAVVATLLFGLVSSLPVMYVLGFLYGIGYGTYYAVDWALAVDVLPNGGAEAGKDMALWHVSFTLPQVLAPAIVGSVLHSLNETGHHVLGVATGSNLGFRFVFGTAAVWFVLGTVMVHQIRTVR